MYLKGISDPGTRPNPRRRSPPYEKRVDWTKAAKAETQREPALYQAHTHDCRGKASTACF
jgi:hypothetical protein